MARPATTVTLAEILRVLETKTGLIECLSRNGQCSKVGKCTIETPMADLNHKFRRILEETKLADFITVRKTQEISMPVISVSLGDSEL